MLHLYDLFSLKHAAADVTFEGRLLLVTLDPKVVQGVKWLLARSGNGTSMVRFLWSANGARTYSSPTTRKDNRFEARRPLWPVNLSEKYCNTSNGHCVSCNHTP